MDLKKEKTRACTKLWEKLLDSKTVQELEGIFCLSHGGDRWRLEQFRWENQHKDRAYYKSESALNVAINLLNIQHESDTID